MKITEFSLGKRNIQALGLVESYFYQIKSLLHICKDQNEQFENVRCLNHGENAFRAPEFLFHGYSAQTDCNDDETEAFHRQGTISHANHIKIT